MQLLLFPYTVFKFFYSLDTNIDADGKMMVIATRNFPIITLDNFFPDAWDEQGAIPPGSPGSSGIFLGGMNFNSPF